MVDPAAGLDGVPNFESLDALLGSGVPLDAVAFCCPPHCRAALAIAALDAGVAVLLEKPPAASLAEAQAVVAHAASLKDAALFAAWHSRCAAMVPAAAAALEGETLARGAIVWRESAAKWHPNQPWLWAPSGFGVLDPGINALSILIAVAGDGFRVEAAAFEIFAHRDAPVAGRVTLRRGAAEVSVELDFREQHGERWTIDLETASGRRVALSDGGARLAVDGVEVASPADDPGEYPQLYRRFAEVVRARAIDVDLAPFRLALAAIEAAECRIVPMDGV